jgi:hypothetical protein
MNHENSMAEQIRQFNASLAEDRRQFNTSLSYKNGSSGSTKSSSTVKGGASTKNKKKLPVDKESIIDLGYGHINSTKLDELVKSGEVVEYEEDGKIKFRKAANWDRFKNFFGWE